MSGIRPPDYSKFAKNSESGNDATIFWHDVIAKFFRRCFSCQVQLLVQDHVNIITSSGLMTVFFYKGFTRNPDIGNTPVWVLPNISRLGQAMDTKLGTNVSNRMLLSYTKFRGYTFYRFWVIKRKPTGGGGVKLPPSHPG